jgi:hypothetical protein
MYNRRILFKLQDIKVGEEKIIANNQARLLNIMKLGEH